MRQIEISLDVFAAIWSARLPTEASEDDVLRRVLKVRSESPTQPKNTAPVEATPRERQSIPPSVKWTELLTWSLEQLGGCAPLADIYRKSREGRRSLGRSITLRHDDSARECLESHCRESKKFRGKADLFWMPYGKGAGIWALRSWRPQ